MRWISSLKDKKMKAHTKMISSEERDVCKRAALHGAEEVEGRGVHGGKLIALAVCIASTDTLSSGGITFLLSSVFSFTFSSSRSPSKSVRCRAAWADGFGRATRAAIGTRRKTTHQRDRTSTFFGAAASPSRLNEPSAQPRARRKDVQLRARRRSADQAPGRSFAERLPEGGRLMV